MLVDDYGQFEKLGRFSKFIICKIQISSKIRFSNKANNKGRIRAPSLSGSVGENI